MIKARISSETPKRVEEARPLEIKAARLLGEDIPLVVAGRLGGRDGIHRLFGRIRGARIEGEILTGTRSPEHTAWSATRQ